MAGDTRIVLVKPGDVLMLGNVTLPDDEHGLETFTTALRTLREVLGLEHDILVFEDDIDLAVKPGAEFRWKRPPRQLTPEQKAHQRELLDRLTKGDHT